MHIYPLIVIIIPQLYFHVHIIFSLCLWTAAHIFISRVSERAQERELQAPGWPLHAVQEQPGLQQGGLQGPALRVAQLGGLNFILCIQHKKY